MKRKILSNQQNRTRTTRGLGNSKGGGLKERQKRLKETERLKDKMGRKKITKLCNDECKKTKKLMPLLLKKMTSRELQRK